MKRAMMLAAVSGAALLMVAVGCKKKSSSSSGTAVPFSTYTGTWKGTYSSQACSKSSSDSLTWVLTDGGTSLSGSVTASNGTGSVSATVSGGTATFAPIGTTCIGGGNSAITFSCTGIAGPSMQCTATGQECYCCSLPCPANELPTTVTTAGGTFAKQ